MKSNRDKKSLIKYFEEHPQERFWQSIKNWSGFPFILAQKVGEEPIDTYYFENAKIKSRKKREKKEKQE